MRQANKPEIQYNTKEALEDVKPLWLSHFAGDLATICREEVPMRGYPFASVIPYVLDDNYQPIFYMGEMAEHCQNILENPKASLMIRENNPDKNIQAQWRLTAVGDVLPLGDSEDDQRYKDRYFAFYPAAKDFVHAHYFRFFRFEVKKFRSIMDFGKIRWLSADAVFQTETLDPMTQKGIIEHMNDDHHDTYPKYLKSIGIEPKADPITMVSVNPYGTVLKQNENFYFIPFAEFSPNGQAVKNELIRLARA